MNGRKQPVTFNGETVRSFGERHIADYLAMHGIDYVYEDPYGIGDYRPDFHIAGTDVWIEYWGVDRHGNVPGWFDRRDGLDPSVAYRESMEWKRRVHRDHGTPLIELYAWQRVDGTLDDSLSGQLRANGIRGSRLKALGNRVRRSIGLDHRPQQTKDSTAGPRIGRKMRINTRG